MLLSVVQYASVLLYSACHTHENTKELSKIQNALHLIIRAILNVAAPQRIATF